MVRRRRGQAGDAAGSGGERPGIGKAARAVARPTDPRIAGAIEQQLACLAGRGRREQSQA